MICGVDVSSKTLDARVGRQGPSASFANDEEGIAGLAQFCRLQKVDLVVMEATGGYEQQAFALLWACGLGVAIVNARSVRKFAQAMGILEKTDQLDSGVIAWFAEVKKVVAMHPASVQQQRLKAMVTRLRQLTELRAGQRNQRLLVTEATVREGFHQLLVFLNQQIRALEKEIAAIIGADPMWAKLDQSFRSIKGVADRTVARLMAEMPEIGVLSNKKISKLAGLAPLAADSGKSQGKRTIYGGRQAIRDILFVVAGVVSRHNPDFSAFQTRLAQAGKAKKVIRIALAHKLLVRLNAKARVVRQQFNAAPLIAALAP